MHQYKEVLLKVENVNLRYEPRQILRDVNFEIRDVVRPDMNQGQVVSLIGRSGIGKTQLFKILSGLIKPTSGNVFVDIDQHPVISGEVGVVPQNYILFNHRTIFENLKIGMRYSGVKQTEKEKESVINHFAETFELKDHLKKFPMQLSGGQRQRVSLIQQMLTGNKFILLDEPFSGLDALMIDKIIELLVKISNLHDYNTLIIVSHDIENCLAISDSAYILAEEKGKEGATITESINLIDLGFAWKPDIKKNKDFIDFVGGIKYKI